MKSANEKAIESIIQRAVREYTSYCKKTAHACKRGTKRSYFFLDDLERAKRQTGHKGISDINYIEGLNYQQLCKAERQLIDSLEEVDKNIFGCNNSFGVFAGYEFTEKRLLEWETTNQQKKEV